jgi:hypothetical protein
MNKNIVVQTLSDKNKNMPNVHLHKLGIGN